MAVALEQRIQRKIDQAHFREPAEVIARALDAIKEGREDWFQRNRDALSERLEDSMAQARRGETYTPQPRSRLVRYSPNGALSVQVDSATPHLIRFRRP